MKTPYEYMYNNTMDLTQRKLTREEWNSVEISVSKDEKDILQMIMKGYHDNSIIENKTPSLLSYLKIAHTPVMEQHIYQVYCKDIIEKQKKKASESYSINFIDPFTQTKNAPKTIKKADIVRLEQNDVSKIKELSDSLFEFILLSLTGKLLKYATADRHRWNYYYYTLYHCSKLHILHPNKGVLQYVNELLIYFEDHVDITSMIARSHDYIEKNQYVYKHADMKLYVHQKRLFSICKQSPQTPKLILYIAPTATGKTLSPIGLSEGHKIIFVCAARHVGVSLAKYAISMGKRIALAFGCETADDIRLHYFAAKEYTKDWRSGQIRKVDNSIGDKVEIMITDIRSYLCSMYYMAQFHPKENIITYWDEPTITMDYESHPCHEIIHRNWSENIIPNMVLSSATLPKMEEIQDVVQDFRGKFMGAEIHTITSHDCKKSIPIINPDGFVEMPHFVCNTYDKLTSCMNHCTSYLTILRYFDLYETARFVVYLIENPKYLRDERYQVSFYFTNLNDVTMEKIKHYYLQLLSHVKEESWPVLYQYFQQQREYRIHPNMKTQGTLTKGLSLDTSLSTFNGNTAPHVNIFQSVPMGSSPKDTQLRKMKSMQQLGTSRPQEKANPILKNNGIYVSTKDAYTLTDGPTIYIANDVEKIGRFCIQQAAIPSYVMKTIMETIATNHVIRERITKLEKQIEDASLKEEGKEKKIADGRFDDNVKKMINDLQALQSMVKSVALDDVYIPNKRRHLEKWVEQDMIKCGLPFTSDIQDNDVETIMMQEIDNIWKVLLLLGIGLFSQEMPIEYTELVKQLADTQKLYLIIANGDYIYGTNYQFCHGFVGKDVLQMTQEKAIQAFGRIGRNKLQHNYSVRVRMESLIEKIYFEETDKIEVRNMNRLFASEI